MLRRSALTPIHPDLHGEGDDTVSLDAFPDWVPRRFATVAPRVREDDDGLGVRALLNRPEAQSRAWRETTERFRSPGRRHRGSTKRGARIHHV